MTILLVILKYGGSSRILPGVHIQGVCSVASIDSNSLGINIAQKPYIVWSLGPKAVIYESLDPQGLTLEQP